MQLKSEKKRNNLRVARLGQKVKDMEVTLDNDQSQQLGNFIQHVEPSQVDQAVQDLQDRDAAQVLKEAFFEDQRKNSKYGNT
jgi:L-arabinose isomerase